MAVFLHRNEFFELKQLIEELEEVGDHSVFMVDARILKTNYKKHLSWFTTIIALVKLKDAIPRNSDILLSFTSIDEVSFRELSASGLKIPKTLK